jgi:COMPASS component SPP1
VSLAQEGATFKVSVLLQVTRLSTEGLSRRYCSDACGVHHMILTMQERQVEDDQIMQYVKDARQPEAYIQDHTTHTQGERIGCASAAKSRQDAQLREDQQILLERRDLLAERLRLAEHKIGLLDAAIKAAEALPDLEVLPEDTADAPKKKGKKPSKAKPGPSAEDRRPCGFDESLLVDTMEAADDDRTDAPGSDVQLRSVCVQPKRKCTRHTGWQKVRGVALEMEQTSLVCNGAWHLYDTLADLLSCSPSKREEAMRLAGRIRT